MRKYFGTDGIRGIANVELTADLAFRTGAAGAFVLQKHSEHKGRRVKVIIGTDTRVSKDLLSCAIAAGIMSVGADVIDVGVIPTPGVAYLTRVYEADAGIVISASHNPSQYNGIKFFNSKGLKLPDEIEEEIESYIDDPQSIVADTVGCRSVDEEAVDVYANYLTSLIDGDFKELRITMDCSNGAAYSIAPKVFEKLGAKIQVINCEPDGKNINLNCGSTHLDMLKKAVKENRSDFGLAYDGDADRLLVVDEAGELVDGDKLLLISAMFLKKKNMLKNNTLVVTVMSNLGLKIAAKQHGIDLSVTAVGDRYVLEDMLKNDYCIGGEQSGHMIFTDYNTTGDGVLSSLILADIVKSEGKSLRELATVMEVYPQVLINAKVKPEYKHNYMQDKEIQEAIEKIEELFHGEGRVLIRPSGTEPLVRVMIEGKDQNMIENEARQLARLIENKLS